MSEPQFHRNDCDRVRFSAAATHPNDIECNCGLEPAREVRCPDCGALEGELCLSRKGNNQRHHRGRVRAAHKARLAS